MNGNQHDFRELSALSDSKLQALMGDIAAALGADPRRLQGIDMSRLRTTLSTISDEDAKRLIERAGKEKAEEIYRAIQRSRADG